MLYFGLKTDVMEQNKLLIYIVDDDLIYGMVATKTIKATGIDCAVVNFNSSLQCLAHLKDLLATPAKLPDFVFIDLNIPGMDGWLFVESLQELHSNEISRIKIYIMSSTKTEADGEKARSNRLIQGFLEKPVLKESFHLILSP